MSAGPGSIEIRGRPLDSLANGLGFLDLSTLLVLGSPPAQPCGGRWADRLAAAFETCPRVDEGGAVSSGVAPPPLLAAIERIAGEPGGADPLTEAASAYAALLTALIGMYRPGWRLPAIRNLIAELAAALSLRPLAPEEVRALEVHMSLQIESPNSPSSQRVRQSLRSGAGLAPVLRDGVERFWRRDHGTASVELARLLLALREVADADAQVRRLIDQGERVPGFGSHEHKGGCVDPRVPVYRRVTGTLRQRNPVAWYWKKGEQLAEAVRTVQEERGRPPLPLNPDYYMTLLHLCLDIPPERMPMSFLAARSMGWCAAFVESRTGR